ncbi:transcriptional regulator [Prauserella marina]|uniref:Helix-turn-helix domain-containing protein n=1 Tax=Prauserella marina TaxID=530584 RepID=A0A222VR91_9PSEU|nr:helix-turn-helix domain-containing protein [Prauserella marina]ASR36428.1 transcriptional regulator [Prauserella marina]PWV77238.1 ArsR family transcriptional regulator [Prauserella marina]SDD07562.1 Helix-turn-helix domain-containing protein [Prauserella marina]
MAALPERRRVRDAELMRALAHPLRTEVLGYLMSAGPRTATQCAEAVGATASNCSWHLRQLAEFGLVERVEGDNARERPWRASQVGLDFGAVDPGSASHTAHLGMLGANLTEEQTLTRRALDALETVPEPWRDAMAVNRYGLRLTAEELTGLIEQVDALIRPYVSTVRTEVPDDARPVYLGLRAFLRFDADGTPSA